MDDDMDRRVRALLERPEVRGARSFLLEQDARILGEQRELTEIPAPPFGEQQRAARVVDLFRDAGLAEVTTDREGNVVGRYGAGAAPVILSAHLDTVFPAGTDVRVRAEGDRLVGPGISDDGRGLAALVALARCLVATGLPVGRPVLFVATVGEEGAGDLRGVRHLFSADGLGSAAGFISLDGAGVGRIVNGGLGSRRFRIEVRGRGGHSWVDWGVPNPIHALGRAVAGALALEIPREPRTTLTVARWGGGTSINAIPRRAWVELEVRSLEVDRLDALEARLRDVVREAVEAEAAGGGKGEPELRMGVTVIGDRPAGLTARDEPLVRAAVAATRALGVEPELATSSTDANVPMALGVPAITIGAGGEAGQAHTPDEWYRNEGGPAGVFRALLTVLALAGPDRG